MGPTIRPVDQATPLTMGVSSFSYTAQEPRTGDGDHVEVHLALTREWPEGWDGYRRKIDKAILAEVSWPPAEKPLKELVMRTAEGPFPMETSYR